ncbi:MAG: ATP-grasp domain-containing protein [Atopobiaceae bacterium]|nr:ATP-grasp domain-containing protein [Atopobiaceae bacterium]
MQKSILMLGGSRQQVVAIECAKRLGLRTVLCDYLPDNPGQYVADVFYQESTTDRERMLEIAKAEGVSGVLAYSSDPAAPTAAYVAEQLGLPTNPLSAVETLSEKHLFRAHLQQVGLPCPKAQPLVVGTTPQDALRAAEELRMRYPVVIKPTDSSGSKGVTVIESPNVEAIGAALAHAAEFSRNKTLLMEEYIRAAFPRVIGGDVFVVDGEVRFWGLMSCLRDEGLGGLVPIGERNPSGLSSGQEREVKRVVQKLVSSLDLRFGELNVEVIVGEGDVPYMLELGARAGGNMIPVQLTDISGIDLVEANVRNAVGDASMPVDFDGNDAAYATYVLHADRSGIFEGVNVSPQIEGCLYRKVMYVEPGDQVESFDGANKALGIFFLRFDSVARLEEAMSSISGLISPIVR